jgi:hypothetical protein
MPSLFQAAIADQQRPLHLQGGDDLGQLLDRANLMLVR